jgi:FAD/FMN-containing dehydrogenase
MHDIALRAGDPGYEEASRTFMAAGSPAVVVKARDASDVAAAIRLAAENDAVLSVRSGGHSAPGFGTNDGGVVIDLSGIDSVDVLDTEQRLVRVGAGAKWGSVADRLAEHGLALTSGDTRSVGVGGLTLGGGIGWMVRKYGLTIDSVRAADVVTAEGTTLRTSADEHPDLFWALRGGSGNFGVVTHFEFEAQPVTTIVAGTIAYAGGEPAVLLASWRDAMRSAPDELSTALLLMPAFGEMPPGVSVFVCYAGADGDEARAALDPLLKVGEVASSTVQEMPYADVLEEAHPPPGVRSIVTNTLVRDLTDEVIADIAAAYAGGRAGRVVFLRSLGGAAARVPADATAFAHRDAEAMVVSGAFLPMDADDEAVEAVNRSWQGIAQHGVGIYGNFHGTATPEDIALIYPAATYERLALVKRAYDPANLFSQTYNVAPA